ncbi:TPA: hypothetical protein ACH3X1_015764 [Trebouxia sp. C0004]
MLFLPKPRVFQHSCCHALVRVVYSNVSAQYYSAYASNNPSQCTLRVLYVLEQLGVDIPPQASQADNTTIMWIGPTLLDLPASANVPCKSLLMALLILAALQHVGSCKVMMHDFGPSE